MTVLADSDILIEVSLGKDAAIFERWMNLSLSDDTVLYSPVNAAELWAGARPREFNAVTKLFEALFCAPIGEEVGRLAGDYLRQYRKSHSLELGDALIAATAVLNRAELWTRKRKH